MNGLLLSLTWLAPVLGALFALTRAGARWPLALAALPALATALLVPVGTFWEVPWFLLGAQFGLDAPARIFLLFTALLWLVAGLQADLTMRGQPQWHRFRLFFLLAMAGNFWLIVGFDLVSFFLGFALMGLAAYGLVIHHGDAFSLRAGRVYLIMTLLAEVALFAALLLVFRHTETLTPAPELLTGLNDWAIGLLVLGLGIKAGLLLLHVWLPLAHPAAPVPASAVLSGAMIKVALLGWMRFLPLGQEAIFDWGTVLLILGAATVLYAIPVGLVQTNPKVLLAYSSVGKMGLMTAFLGLALLAPSLAPVIATALVLYAAHHGLAKGALFLGVGIVRETKTFWTIWVLTIPALVLAGAPYTSGALAKALLKPPLSEMQGPWVDAIPWLLITSTIGTTLLMARFMTLMGAERPGASNASVWAAMPWLGLIGVILAMPVLIDFPFPQLASSWPMVLGILMALLAARWRPAWRSRILGSIPAGDVLVPALRWTRQLRGWPGDYSTTAVLARIRAPAVERWGAAGRRLRQWRLEPEQFLYSWPVAGAVTLVIGTALFLLL